MASIEHRRVATNGIDMHIAEAGRGPLVVLCHGFPESWYSWRHQLPALADAGFHVVAPDQRGYGQTDAPDENDAYTQFHLVGDIVGLVAALGERNAVIGGHDWGAPVAWNAALWRPDVFRAVAALSVPFANRTAIAPIAAMQIKFGDNFFYILYFQQPGVADTPHFGGSNTAYDSFAAEVPAMTLPGVAHPRRVGEHLRERSRGGAARIAFRRGARRGG